MTTILILIISTAYPPTQIEFSSLRQCLVAKKQLEKAWTDKYRSTIFAECILK